MLKQYESKAVQIWQSPNPPLGLRVASKIFGCLISIRRAWYKALPRRCSVPVIVVGNICVGGSGKTPVVIALSSALKQLGFNPGIVSRGYQSTHNAKPTQISVHHQASQVGDEPLLIHHKTGLPTVIGRNRYQAVKFLLKQNPKVNIIISDDGLQHYRMPRSKEIAMVDLKSFGNGKLLPAGPLREPLSRLKHVDYRLSADSRIGDYQVEFVQTKAVHLHSGEVSEDLEIFKGRKVHAVAAIANPERFFQMLEAKGISIYRHVFPDHYALSTQDLDFDSDLPILMTEKDAIKCCSMKGLDIWSVDLQARLDPKFITKLVKDIIDG